MAKDFLSKAADLGKDIYEGAKKMQGEKLPDRELDKYRGELENLKKNLSKLTVDQVTIRLRDAFMIDMDELGITSEQEKGIYWEQAFREANLEINALAEGRIEQSQRTLDQFITASTHDRLQEMIGEKDPEAEGKSVFTEILDKFPGGKKGLAMGFSLLSFLGIKKGSKMEKFINYLKGLFGFEDEKEEGTEGEAEGAKAEGAKADEEKKGPKLSAEANEALAKFKDAHITLATDNLNADYRSLVAETGGKEKAFKSIEKGLKENSNYRKIHTAINAVVKEKQFKHRLIDIQLNDLSDIEAGKIAKAIENKKEDADPKKIRSFLDSIRKEPKKVAQLIKKFEKIA